MSAYVITDVTIHDAGKMAEYQQHTPATVEAFDGRFVARGGQVTLLEGGWDPQRIVVIEFPSVEKANAWWHSDAYAPLKKLRQENGTTKMIIVQGAQ